MSGYRKACYEHHKKEDKRGTYLLCHLCQGRINPAVEKWEAEHIVPRALGGADTPENVWPAHTACHRPKTSQDVGAVAKSKRVRAKHLGLKEKGRGWDRRYRKKLNGEVVRRD